jgi:hypothetical protein
LAVYGFLNDNGAFVPLKRIVASYKINSNIHETFMVACVKINVQISRAVILVKVTFGCGGVARSFEIYADTDRIRIYRRTG